MSERETIEATAAQRRAIDPAASVWVEASAGSGKTTVLTNRALTLLLHQVAPERLLCLTFTKVAAAEMANRIAGQLARWASAAEEKLSTELAQLTGQWPDEARLVCARGLFARVLDCQGGLKIQTIHSFCQSVLARFPLEAGVSPHFLLLDEAAAVEELAQARRLVLIKARSGADPLLTAALARVAERAESEGFAHLLDGAIAERGRLRRLLADKGGVAGAVAALAGCLRIAPDSTQEQVMEQAWAKVQSEATTWRCLADGLGVLGKTPARIAAQLRAALAAGNAADGMRLLADALLTKKGEARKISAKCPPALANDWQKCLSWFLRIQSCAKSAGILALSSALLCLAEAVLNVYDQAKRSRALLDFDDLILATRRLLEREGGASWALYKLDGGIDHVLVDEAQDTNPDQWAVVAALAQEFFAGHGAVERRRSLFVVGDAKQSIFSFQRADPKAFLQMQGIFRQWVSDAGQTWREVPLEYSFRSLPAVLQAVDTVFAGERAARGVAEPGSLRHRATRADQPGLVELWPLARATLAEDEEPWSLPRHRLFVESADSRLARLIAARIQRWLEDGEWLAARHRPMRAGDILVLVRQRGVFGDALVRALKQRGIAVAGQDRMRLTGQLAVMDLMALGRFLLLPEDDLTLAAVLKSPLIGLGEDALLHLAAERGEQSLWSRLRCLAEGESNFAAARDYLDHWLGRVDFQPPYELFADVLAQGGRMRLLERLGEEAADPIDEFLNRCLIHERDRQPSLQGLLHWLETVELEIKRESDGGGRDEVRIMTVHGAKGLQAPVVILPDTTTVPDPARDKRAKLLWTADGIGPFWRPSAADHDPLTKALYAIHADGQQQEYRRLLYVAMTRAEDRLYIAGAAGKGKENGASWYDLAQEALRPVAQPAAFDFRDFGFDDWRGEGLRLGRDGKEGLPARPAPGEARAADSAVVLPDWSRQPAPEEPRPFRPLSPSRLGEEPPVRSPLTSADGIGYRRGRLVHRLLQHLPEADPSQWPSLAPVLLRRFAPDCAGDDIALLAAQALAVLAEPACADLFGPGSRAEVSVAGQVGPIAITGRIDRLAVIGDRVLAVDFKSNRPPPALADAVAKPYLRQMALYRALLRQIYPAHRIETALVWTDGPSLMWLPDALLDRAVDLDAHASI